MNEQPNPRQAAKRGSGGRRILLLVIGWFLVIISPIVGALPGPGFIILFPVGLALILKNSLWAKKRYSKFARSHPEYGDWMNWALRRRKEAGRPPVPPLKQDLKRLFRLSRS